MFTSTPGVNASDDDDFDDQPVLAEEDALPVDEDMFDRWEEEEIVANRTERLARVSVHECTHGRTDRAPPSSPASAANASRRNPPAQYFCTVLSITALHSP